MNEETLNNLTREEAIKLLDSEIDYSYQLKHNWNELKKWLEERYLRVDSGTDFEIVLYMTLDKMQSLEEGGNNDC